jgi:hypothetical protein
MAGVIDLETYIERTVKAKKAAAEREKFSAWAIAHLQNVAKRFGCDITHPEALKGFRMGAQWVLDMQERHERDVLAALKPRWDAMGINPLKK